MHFEYILYVVRIYVYINMNYYGAHTTCTFSIAFGQIWLHLTFKRKRQTAHKRAKQMSNMIHTLQ